MYSIEKIPIGIYEKAIPNSFTWKEKLICAKKAGFDYLEISIDESDERLSRLKWSDEEIENLRSLTKEIGIPIPSMCLSGHRKFPFGSKCEKTREKAFEIMKDAIYFAFKMGIRVIQLATYDVYYEHSDDETKELFIEGMKKAVEMASRAGVILSMEIMDTPFAGTITNAMEFIQKVQSPYFKIYPDIGNLSNFAKDICAELELGISQITSIHVKETVEGVFREVTFGQGRVEFAKIFKKLKELNYSGLFLIEMWADNSKEIYFEEAVSNINEARNFVVLKMKEAGILA